MKNKVFQRLVDYYGEGVSRTYEHFGQLKLKNGVELTLYERNTGFDVYMVLNDGHNIYEAFTGGYAIDNIDGLIIETETNMDTIFKRKSEDKKRFVEAYDKWLGVKK